MEAIIEALDLLGVTLAEYNHQWTPEERKLYETAVRIAKKELRRRG